MSIFNRKHNNRINLFGNLSYSVGNGYNDLGINRHFLKPNESIASHFLQHTYIHGNSHHYYAKVGMDYYASDKTTFGIGLTEMISNFTNITTSSSKLLDAQNTLDSK